VWIAESTNERLTTAFLPPCRFPAPASKEDGDKLVSIAKEINAKAESKIEEIDETVLRHLASGSSADLSPMAAMLGGVVGQEVVKACSGKFHPLFQVRHIALSCLPCFL
jgi:ubiquitin-activating enzyme E1